MKLYIIRHGETNWNKERKIQGASDIPLNDFGRVLAQQTAQGLKEIPFDAAFTSPLCRARETAQIILEGRDVPLVEDDRIKEICFGEYEGLCCSEEGWNVPDSGFENFFQAPDQYHPPKGGEDFTTVLNRLNSFLQELYQKKEWETKNVLLATHGAALCGMLTLIKENPIAQYWESKVHKNCAVTIVEVEEQQPKILEEAKIYYTEEVAEW
ncbi:MAG: histidine phosphatase family protein [Lachnospiraceae bacterium]